MTRSSVGLASLTGLALLAAFWLGRTSAPVGPAATPRPASESARSAQPGGLAADGAELETARARIRELEAQLAWLQAQVDALRQAEAAGAAASGASGRRAADGQPGSAGSEIGGSENAGWEFGESESDGSESDGSGFDAAELLARGVSPSEVERLRQLYEQAPPEPGEAKWKEWLEERLARDERLELERATRAEIGDEAYDEMLYADGRNNAVRVRKLLEHSAGRAFGLEPGDVVLRYDGERVFNAQDLRQAAKQGNPGDTVIMDVLRGDEILPLTGPRGPIGFRPVGTLVPPSGVWYH